jgi:hypothetical protein
MDSAHAEAAVVLINAGADRTRVRRHSSSFTGNKILGAMRRKTWRTRLLGRYLAWVAGSRNSPDNMLSTSAGKSDLIFALITVHSSIYMIYTFHALCNVEPPLV